MRSSSAERDVPGVGLARRTARCRRGCATRRGGGRRRARSAGWSPCARPSGPWSRCPAGRGSRGCPTRSRSPRRSAPRSGRASRSSAARRSSCAASAMRRTVPGWASRQPGRGPAGPVHEVDAREQRVPGTGDAPLGTRPRARGRTRSRPRDLRQRWVTTADSLHVVERLAVTLVGPLRALVAERGVEADRVQRPLDVVGVVALLEQRERDAAGTPARLGQRRLGQLRLGPLGVRGLQRRAGGGAGGGCSPAGRCAAPPPCRTSGPRTRGRTA